MKATEIKDLTTNKAHCDWVIEQAKELKALLSYNSESMILDNKVRALSAIDAAMSSLRELRISIENVQERYPSSLDDVVSEAQSKTQPGQATRDPAQERDR